MTGDIQSHIDKIKADFGISDEVYQTAFSRAGGTLMEMKTRTPDMVRGILHEEHRVQLSALEYAYALTYHKDMGGMFDAVGKTEDIVTDETVEQDYSAAFRRNMNFQRAVAELRTLMQEQACDREIGVPSDTQIDTSDAVTSALGKLGFGGVGGR